MMSANRDDYAHFLPIRVRWGEMDALGHVNNTVFYQYAEDGRLDYLGQVVDRGEEPANHHVILAELNCRFLRQLKFPAEVEIATRTTGLGNTSLVFQQALFRRNEAEAVATYAGAIVWFDFERQVSVPVPESMRQRIRALERVAPAE